MSNWWSSVRNVGNMGRVCEHSLLFMMCPLPLVFFPHHLFFKLSGSERKHSELTVPWAYMCIEDEAHWACHCIIQDFTNSARILLPFFICPPFSSFPIHSRADKIYRQFYLYVSHIEWPRVMFKHCYVHTVFFSLNLCTYIFQFPLFCRCTT